MKKIGLVGGISWTSTLEYYRLINEGVNQKLGGLQAAKCLIDSINFGELQQVGWDNAFDLLEQSCANLKRGGADSIALCANTAHLYADKLNRVINLPVINIVTETVAEINRTGIKTVGLIGTKFTMESGLYTDPLRQYGLQALLPEKQSTRDYIQQTLKEELGAGIIRPETRRRYHEIANELIKEGSEGIILGCTELPLIFNEIELTVPVFDTMKIHCNAIVAYSTDGSSAPNAAST